MAMDYNQRKQQYESFDEDQKQQWDNMVSNAKEGDISKKFMEQYKQEQQPKVYNEKTGFYEAPKVETPTPTPTPTEVSPDLDTSKFNTAPGQVTVKEGTAQQTGKPDYEISTDARLNEMKSNLDQYFKDSPRMFSDRETFNKVFEYDTRTSEAQKQLLDSYWKRKQDVDTASKYNTGDAISNGMKDAEITTDQLNYIKEYSPAAYAEYMQKQIEEINLRIANLATPADPTNTAELFNSLLQKLNLEPGDPYQIYDNWYNMAERLGVFSDSEKLKDYQTKLDANHAKMESIMSRYASGVGGTVSDALSAARMQKALAPYQQIEVDLQNSYTTLLNGRNSNLAVANQSATALAMQAQEDQRVWNQRLQGLGFAMTTANYRSPEQQAQLQLQTQQIQNDMSLLQTALNNNLSLYNSYATAKLQNQLQNELTDLSVTDPEQLKANLNNVLSQYYSQWGDIIKRPQAEVVEDVLAYAKKNGVSVAEALRKNFIEPLQSKQEYKNKIATNYAAPTSTNSIGYSKITINGKDYLMSADGRIIDPASIGIGTSASSGGSKPYNIVAPEIMEAGVDDFVASHPKDMNGGQCGKFVNDYLVAIGATASNNRYFGNEDVWTRAKRCNQQTAAKGAVAVFNYNHLSDDKINHGHVAIVTQVYKDGSFDVIESNYPSGEKVNKRHIEANDSSCLGFINPSLGASSSQGYSTKDPYSGVSKYTSTGKEINAGGWITSLEKSFDRWEKLTDTQRKDIYTSYGIDISELNEQRERYMNYVETVEMVNNIVDVKKRAEALKEWAEQDENKDLKGYMDISIANQGYANPRQSFWTTDDTIENIQEGKSLYDNLMANASFQKYLDMRDKGAQFGIMTDSEWRKIDSSVDPLKWEMKDDLFLDRINSMIDGYNDVLMQLGYDFGEGEKPEKASDLEMKNQERDGTLERYDATTGKTWISVDGGLTRY